MDRKEQLVRAAKARAILTAFLIKAVEPETPDRLAHLVEGLGYTLRETGQLLARMADQGLIQKVEVDHGRYDFGYQASGAGTPTEEPARRKRKSKTLEQELDVKANLDGSITLKFRGLVMRVSVES